MFISFLIKRLQEELPNKELPEELHKPIIKKLKERKVYSFFISNNWVLILPICK